MSIRLEVGSFVFRLFSKRERAALMGTPIPTMSSGFLALNKENGKFYDDTGAVPTGYAHEIIEVFVVIARDDRTPEGEKGAYSLSTRRVFLEKKDAEEYAATINPSREPIVTYGRFFDLQMVCLELRK